MHSASGGVVLVDETAPCGYAITTVDSKRIFNWDTKLFEVMPTNNTPAPSHLRLVPQYLGSPIGKLRVERIPEGIPETADPQIVLLCYLTDKNEFLSYIGATPVIFYSMGSFRFEAIKQ